jgi:hypothetical protein
MNVTEFIIEIVYHRIQTIFQKISIDLANYLIYILLINVNIDLMLPSHFQVDRKDQLFLFN